MFTCIYPVGGFLSQCRATLRTFSFFERSAGVHCAHFYFRSSVQGYTAHIFIFWAQFRSTLRTFLFSVFSAGLHCAHFYFLRIIIVSSLFHFDKMVKKGKNSKNFQLYIVKSSFSDVKTYEKLIFFIIFLDWHKIMFNHAEW